MFKAQRKDGKGEVRGWLNYDAVEKNYFIMDNNWFRGANNRTLITALWHEIIPSTLSMQTGQTDKHGEMIYGSFMLDGKMTEGGDMVYDEANKQECDIVFIDGAFCMVNLGDEECYIMAQFACDQFLEIIKGK